MQVVAKIKEDGGERYSASGRRNSIRDDTCLLIQAVVASCCPTTILELGTGYGLSTCYLAMGNSDAIIHTVECNPEAAQKAKTYLSEAGLASRICHWVCSSKDAIERIPNTIPFPDFVFIDHEKSHYKKDIQEIIDRCRGRPLTVVADNVIDRKSEVADFLEWIPAVAKNVSLIPTQCGLLIAHIAQ